MKSSKLHPADRAVVQQMAALMMQMNDLNNAHSDDRNTYGDLRRAIVSFVRIQTGVDIANVDWNLGGWASWVDDIQAAIDDAVELLADAIVDQSLVEGGARGSSGVYEVAKLAAKRLREEFDWDVSHDAFLAR
jgi:hypothetical protein